jgi:16S rRNA (cytidine1402-2'-O)-methyltransferase
MVPHSGPGAALSREIGPGRSNGVDDCSAPGTLHVVATPIGNLGDITLRAVKVLGSVRLVVAEDTRHTGRLLAHLGIRVPLLSFHEHNRAGRIPRILDALALGDVAMVTDAGTPAVSDPGPDLVAAARAAGYPVVAVPGASAVAASLMVAGIASDVAHFLGFLPRRASERRRVLAMAATWPGALVFFEAPHRIAEALEDASEVLGNRVASVCNDLTKRYERVWHAPLAEIVATFRSDLPRGEFTVVVAPESVGSRDAGATPSPDRTSLAARYEALVASMGDRKKAIRRLAQETGQPRKEIYSVLVMQARGEDPST